MTVEDIRPVKMARIVPESDSILSAKTQVRSSHGFHSLGYYYLGIKIINQRFSNNLKPVESIVLVFTVFFSETP